MSKEEVRGGPGSSHLLLRRHHDMGGLPAGAVEPGEHDYAPWEKRVDAILRLLADSKRRLITTDELRRGIEELGPGAYDADRKRVVTGKRGSVHVERGGRR